MSNKSILVVDDNPLNIKMVRMLLVREGYDVSTATSADEALSVLQRVRPQLILMDIQMPGMDGLELTKRLKSDPDTSNIIVVALTAHAMKGEKEKILDGGCDDYVSKPFDIHALLAVIAKHLRSDAP